MLNSFMMEVPIIKKPVLDLQSKSKDWFLYERDLRNERVKRSQSLNNPAAEKIKN